MLTPSVSSSAIYVVGSYARIWRFHPDTFTQISPLDPLSEPTGSLPNRDHCRMERFPSDPSLLAFTSCSDPYDVRVFNVETRTHLCIMNPQHHENHTDGLAVIDDDPTRRTTLTPRRLVVTGDDHFRGVIWDAETGQSIAKSTLPIEYVCRMLYVSDWSQSLFACGCSPHRILRLDVERELMTVAGWSGRHEDQVNDMCPDVEKNVLASVGHDEKANLWDTRGDEVTSIKIKNTGYSVLCLPHLHSILVGATGGSIQLFDLRNLQEAVSSLTIDQSVSGDRTVYAFERVRQNSFAGIVSNGATFLSKIKPSREMDVVALCRNPGTNYGIRMLGDRLDEVDSVQVQDEDERIEFLLQILCDAVRPFGRLFEMGGIVLFRCWVEV